MRDGVLFIHAADLHLDAPFQGIAASHERVGAELADATYTAFSRIVDECIERSVDFLVIAGDAYNSADKSLRAQLRFHKEMGRLSEAGISAFITCGNHDPATGWSAGLSLPESVHVFSCKGVERVEVTRGGETVAAVYGRSFAKAAEKESLCGDYSREAGDAIAVGVLHCNVGGNPDYDPYAPASIEDLRAAGMDYWALGHIHKQEILARDPWIVYCGSAQGLNPKETGPHGCLVVSISGSRAVAVEHVETAPIAWSQQSIDISAAGGLEDVRRALEEACEEIRSLEQRPAVVRFALEGRSAVQRQLARAGVLEELLEDLRAEQSAGQPWLWIDRLDDRSAAEIDLDAVRQGPDYSAEVVRIADALAEDERALAEVLDTLVSELGSAAGEPGITPERALEMARDVALDLLLAEAGEGR